LSLLYSSSGQSLEYQAWVFAKSQRSIKPWYLVSTLVFSYDPICVRYIIAPRQKMRQLSVTFHKCNLLDYQISSFVRKNQLLNAFFHEKRIPNSQYFVSQLDKVLFAHLLLFFCQSHLIDWKLWKFGIHFSWRNMESN